MTLGRFHLRHNIISIERNEGDSMMSIFPKKKIIFSPNCVMKGGLTEAKAISRLCDAPCVAEPPLAYNLWPILKMLMG